MRVWLIGAGKIGTIALRQLKKNPEIEVVVSDPSDKPEAVQQGLIDRVDIIENITSVNVNPLARRIRPDLILISPAASERGFGSMEGGQTLADALNHEIASNSEYPVIILSLSSK
jgi:FlaA1/EpsC-like NDP-sugar epimerase